MNRLDELTDINFKLICKSKSSFSWLHFVDKDGEQLSGQIREQVAKYMEDNGLIQINGENCHLDLKSEQICQSSWAEHLKLKETGKLEKHTIDIINRLKNGDSIPLTKSETDEVNEIIPKLKNIGVLYQPKRFEYACDLTNRQKLTKLIEFQSLEKFLNWSDNEKNKSNFINDFSGANIGQVNQSSKKMDLKSPITKSIVHNTAKEPKKKSWIEILAWIIGIIAGLVAIYEFILKKFID